jgi:predicted double-glycine peptidase
MTFEMAFSPILSPILSLALGSLFFYIGMKIGRMMLLKGATANDLFRGKEWMAIGFIAFYLLLLLVAVNLPQYQNFPLQWRVYGMQGSWILIRSLFLGAIGCAVMIGWRTARVQLGMIAVVGAIGLFCFTAAERHFLSPIYKDLTNNLQLNRIFKQTSSSSCAPAALATLLQRWGLKLATESTVAKAAGTSLMGTTMPQAIQAAQAFGLTGLELKPSWEQMQRINRPGLLAVWQVTATGRKLPHAVALMALDEKNAVVADPATGRYDLMSRAEFKAIWRDEYIPIFRSTEIAFSEQQAIEYLTKLKYVGSFKERIKAFQSDLGIQSTGSLDSATTLMLMGKFLQDAPTLNIAAFNQETEKYMNCENNPDRCVW